MATMLQAASARGIAPDYVTRLLAAFPRTEARGLRTESVASTHTVLSPQSASLVEPLSQRELEVLHLISQGLSNREISERLFLALDTVKGHNQRIFSKLQVQRRTEAVSRARELGLV